MYIYKTTNLANTKIYVGQTIRKSFDTTYLGSGKLIRRAIKKYGIENFKVELLEECSTREELNEAEIQWIAKLDACNLEVGYNLAAGGNTSMLSSSQDVRTKQLLERSSKLSKHLLSINPETNTTYGKCRADKASRTKTSHVVNGLNMHQRSALKQRQTISKIGNRGLTRAQEIAIAGSLTRKSDVIDNLDGHQRSAKKRSATLKQVNPETGLTRAQEISSKASMTKSKADSNGITMLDKAAKKQSSTLKQVNTETGLTRAQEISIAGHITKNTTVNPETGLTRAQEIGKKQSKTKRLQRMIKVLTEHPECLSIVEVRANDKSEITTILDHCGENFDKHRMLRLTDLILSRRIYKNRSGTTYELVLDITKYDVLLQELTQAIKNFRLQMN